MIAAEFPAPQKLTESEFCKSFLSLFCFSGTSSNEPHSVGQCAKWVAWSKEHQETIKFGGLSTSGVVGGGGIGLVYIEIKAEK